MRRADFVIGPRVQPRRRDAISGVAAIQERGLKLGERAPVVERGLQCVHKLEAHLDPSAAASCRVPLFRLFATRRLGAPEPLAI